MLPNLEKVWKIFDEIRDDDSISNDRREYSREDLRLAYDLSEEEAKYLYHLILGMFDPECNFHPEPTDSEIAEYFHELIHNGFDGWEDSEKVIVRMLVDDVYRYVHLARKP